MDIFKMSKMGKIVEFIFSKNVKKLLYYKIVGIFFIITKNVVTIIFFIYISKSI